MKMHCIRGHEWEEEREDGVMMIHLGHDGKRLCMACLADILGEVREGSLPLLDGGPHPDTYTMKPLAYPKNPEAGQVLALAPGGKGRWENPITAMRQLLDVLKTATPAERLEFHEWWGGTPPGLNTAGILREWLDATEAGQVASPSLIVGDPADGSCT